MGKLLTEDILKLIGAPTPSVVADPVEGTAIRDYCENIGEENPYYLDDEFARGSYGGIIAPPVFYQVPFWHLPGSFAPVPTGTDTWEIAYWKKQLGLNRALDAYQNMEFFIPIRPSDVLRRSGKVVDIQEKILKVGEALLLIMANEFTNQQGELVCREEAAYFFY